MVKFAWSFSSLDMFETCPKKLYHVKITKDSKDEDSSYSKEGKIIHDALYHRVVNGTALPLPLRYLEPIAATYSSIPGEKHGELKLALDEELNPVGFFDKSTWVRAIVDLAIVYEDKCLMIDWKTGKPKPGVDQLKLSAAVLSRQMPEIKKFTCAYVWVNHSKEPPTSFTMERKHMKAVWADNYEKVQEIEAAIDTTTFPATPGDPFPCKWCPVRHCPHNLKKD